MVSEYADEQASCHYALKVGNVFTFQPSPAFWHGHMPKPDAPNDHDCYGGSPKSSDGYILEVMFETLVAMMFPGSGILLEFFWRRSSRKRLFLGERPLQRRIVTRRRSFDCW